MSNRMCDRCGRLIEEGELRYVARIQVYAASDPLRVTFEDLMRDHQAEMARLVEQCEGLTEEELMRDIYVEFQFDLCRPCQKDYVAAPLKSAKN